MSEIKWYRYGDKHPESGYVYAYDPNIRGDKVGIGYVTIFDWTDDCMWAYVPIPENPIPENPKKDYDFEDIYELEEMIKILENGLGLYDHSKMFLSLAYELHMLKIFVLSRFKM